MKKMLRELAEKAFDGVVYREMRRAEFEQWLAEADAVGRNQVLDLFDKHVEVERQSGSPGCERTAQVIALMIVAARRGDYGDVGS